MKLQAGLYTIRAGANQEYNADQYASARERIESDIRVVGGRSSEWTQEWQVSPVEGFDDQYTIEVPQPPPPHIPIPLPPVVGFTVDDVESGAIVQLSAPPKGWRICHMPRDDLTIGESYAISVPSDDLGSEFFIQVRNTKEADPPLIIKPYPVIAGSEIPHWLFVPVPKK